MEQAYRPIIVKINVPFCLHDCAFCKRPTIREGRDTQRLHFYAVSVCREIEANAEAFADCEVQAVHFGGGLASSLGGQDVYRIAKTLKENFRIARGMRTTMRASYLDINVGSTPFFRRAGINRLDFEVMSMERLDFLTLDYPDTTVWVSDVSNVLHASTVNNMGMVLLYGIGCSKPEYFRRSLLTALRKNVCHIILQEYEGEDKFDRATLDAMLADGRQVLADHGFTEYLPLRFAKPGCEDVYHVLESRGVDVLAFGMGAATRFDGVRTTNTMDLSTYFCHSAEYDVITETVEKL